jgi:hypothetical protein
LARICSHCTQCGSAVTGGRDPNGLSCMVWVNLGVALHYEKMYQLLAHRKNRRRDRRFARPDHRLDSSLLVRHSRRSPHELVI